MAANGRARANCAGDTVFAPAIVVLRYGQSWRVPTGITCTSRSEGLTCTTRLGHGLFLSRERWRAY